MASRGNRSSMVIATKVAKLPEREGLAPDNVRAALADSLRRLQTDYVDLFYAHHDDQEVPLEDTLGAFAGLVSDGKVRHIAASNHTAPRLAEALEVSARLGLPRYVALQPQYSLVARDEYEGELADVCARYGLACLPYWGLARGFLTGKYRDGSENADSPRAAQAVRYLDERGRAVLAALDEVAAAHSVSVAAVALAWLVAQPTVAATLASARTPEQLSELLPFVGLELSEEELSLLSAASDTRQPQR
jgi:aryl-alcohol dehydrogenase-like predicted oxidoreductase